jgi:hypothetical protein
MNQRISISAMLALLAPWIAIGAIWMRSYYVLDQISLADSNGRLWGLASYQGSLQLIRSPRQTAQPRSIRWVAQRIPKDAVAAAFYGQANVGWRMLGFNYISRNKPYTQTLLVGPFAAGLPLVSWLTAIPFESVGIPFWSLFLIAFPPTYLSIRRWRREWRRWRAGKCFRCGYDLRASENRCPECGETILPGSGAIAPEC